MKPAFLSDNYEITIPSEVRRKVGLKPGQSLYLASVTDTTFTLTTDKGLAVKKKLADLEELWKKTEFSAGAKAILAMR